MKWRWVKLAGYVVESSWNVMAHGDAREGKWRGNWRMEWVASTLHTTLEHGVSSITTADEHTSAASSQLDWRPRRFKWTRQFHRKTKSGFCACAITFQLAAKHYNTAAIWLMGSWFRIPLKACVGVSCVCCVLSGRGLCDGLITRPEESYRMWFFVVCDLGTSWVRRPWPTGGLSRPPPKKKTNTRT